MKDLRVLVVGMARSGIAVAKLLSRHGAIVRINDSKRAAELGSALDELKEFETIEWRLGEPAQDLLDGMDMLLISPGIPIDHPVVLRAQEMDIQVTGELEVALRLAMGKLIAITGTNGKTTTTTLVGEIMKNAGKLTHVVGNIGRAVSEIAFDSRPDDAIVCEVSSFQLETVRDLHPEIAAILNISEDHLYRHHTMENYIAHKARIFANQDKNDVLVLNYDDPALREMAALAKAKIAWFSRQNVVPFGAFVMGESIVFGGIDECRQICPISEIALPGAHNLENALAATAIAMAADVPPPVIRHTLRTFQGVEHRLELVRELDGVRYINDSKGTNVDSTTKAIEAMDRPTVLLLGGRNQNAQFDQLAKVVSNGAIELVVLLGETANEIEQALIKAGFTNYTHAGYDLRKAVELAQGLACSGMNVLLSPACKSFDMFSDFEERGKVFKHIVGELGQLQA
ncbi:UDP-N-acetylmuramoyl-L-alanine--D-glutamate ligase [Eubacteriales bacterium OttesenSCG-928-N13]|nr:UDP-N-acetylmuramoyl-L-alanine--D-glutamate ligase [Eubacteriales bacterium OttesenSCG-928-N13]